jgi:hypothetical protein
MATDHRALEESFGEEDDMLFDGEDDEVGDTLEFGGRPEDEVQEAFDVAALEPAKWMGKAQRELMAIPEADTPSRKSKRRAESLNEHSLERAKRIKAARNLDFTSKKGTNSRHSSSFIHYSNEHVIDNLGGGGEAYL